MYHCLIEFQLRCLGAFPHRHTAFTYTVHPIDANQGDLILRIRFMPVERELR